MNQPLEPTPAMRKVFDQPELLLTTEHSLCPGCGEPIALRLMLELIQELGLRDRTICVAGIGCYTAFPMIMDIDVLQALHGRAPSVATGVKRVRPDAFVFTMQGDGDMVSEGLQEVIHSAARGERFTAVVLNNGVFGETGGHATATTVLGQHTKTTPGSQPRDARQPDQDQRADRAARRRRLRRARRRAHAVGDQADAPVLARCLSLSARRQGLFVRRDSHHVPHRLVRPARSGPALVGRTVQDDVPVGRDQGVGCWWLVSWDR